MKTKKEAAHSIALQHLASFVLFSAKITKENEDSFMAVLDKLNKKQITNKNEFYDRLQDLNIDKLMLKDLVTNVMHRGSSEDIVKMVFLLGEGKLMGEKSPSKGLGILQESWVERQIPDSELTKKIKSKFWPLFRNKEWLAKEKIGIGEDKIK